MQQKKIDELPNYKLKKLAEYLSEEIFGKFDKTMEERFKAHLLHYVDEILTTKQVCEMLGKSKSVIDQMCKRGKIPFHKKDGLRYFSKNELIDYFFK